MGNFLLGLFTTIYGLLYSRNKILNKFYSPFRYLLRETANCLLPKYLCNENTIINKPVAKNCLVSFTSFPARINEVWMVVECLKRQSVLPEKIILWLSKNQFPSAEDVPNNLKQREDSLFEIQMVDEDIRSHKKYYYVMSKYPDKAFITCDDDVFYHPDMIKNLLETSKKYPGCIIANVSSEMTYDGRGELLPYVQWKNNYRPFASYNRVQIGIGGVFYPPNCLNELVLNKALFIELAPYADDLWLSLMARLNKTPIVQSKKNRLSLPIENGSPSLSTVNNGEKNMNDVQIGRMRNWLKQEQLPDIYSEEYIVKYSEKERK